ncbi:monosaccharide-sensing protein 2-like [Euphorbia lathyris]|uniref:monosaccharide-sensing protein 2-like n=1 Tax=Euphorbia lathyris TaxID=212925 RepID=UPI0033135027
MRGAVLVALAAAFGNMLQGWDNATVAGSLLYIKKEFHLQTQPTLEGLIAAMALISATIITTFSGPVSDIHGRRPMLIISSFMYLISGVVMLWSPNVYVLLLGRTFNGFGIGLAVTLVPIYISETAPPEIRGLLNTFPQFMGSGGMFFSYCMVFAISLTDSPNWRLMLGVLSLPSLAYIILTIFYLPESPRWLVSKGRMDEAKKTLQKLRGREDVSGELALLLEGLGVGKDGIIEEYIIGPDDGESTEKGDVKLYGAEDGASWIAKPVTGQSNVGFVSRHGSMANQSVPFMDPLVTLFGSVHENMPSMGSMMLPSTASMLNMTANQGRNEQWDEENQGDNDDSAAESDNGDSDDNVRSPLLSWQGSHGEKDSTRPIGIRRNSSLFTATGEDGATGIGGGWQLAYKYSERTGKDGRKEAGIQRMYLKQDGGVAGSMRGSMLSNVGGDMSGDGEFVQASAIVSQTAMRTKEVLGNIPDKAPGVQPSQTAASKKAPGPSFSDLFEPGVKRALFVGIGLQLLQQVSGINGVLYYTPQILEQAGVAVLLANMGLRSDSASLFLSLLTALAMLPCIMVAMRLMDIAGRRSIMLYTIPVLVVSLLALVLSSVVHLGSFLQAMISAAGVMFYICFFVMGLGAIPNIICSEIFPTSVRGLCITLCALTYWIGDIAITYMLPLLLNSIGLVGVFSVFAFFCVVAWIFVFLKVPETKGMPLEVISEFFAVGATALAKND